MSCGVGLKANGRVYIGVDSAVTGDFQQVVVRSAAKLFRIGPLLIAGAGSRRAEQVIRFTSIESFTGIDRDPYSWLVKRFVVAVRQALAQHGSLDKFTEGSEKLDGVLLIGYRQRLFQIDKDFQVNEFRAEFNAIGDGERFALGALFATKGLEPTARIRLALSAATRYSPAVTPPFIIEATEPKAKRKLTLSLIKAVNE